MAKHEYPRKPINKQTQPYFDTQKKSKEMAIKYPDIHALDGLHDLAGQVVPMLERELYGCNVFVDKIYVYRNNFAKERKSSWIWHYDNNPREVFKTMIYLTDVDEQHAPFEHMQNADGDGLMATPTRHGATCWTKPPNNSRIDEGSIKVFKEHGCKANSVLGPKGTATVFNVNCIHPANLPKAGYRDVVILRTRPTTKQLQHIRRKYTSGFEIGGVCPKIPSKLTPDK